MSDTQATPGPWQIVEDLYEPTETFGQLAGKVAQRRIFTAWDHPQMHGPIGVVNGFTTIGKVCGSQPYNGVSISAADARLIVRSPELVDTLRKLERAIDGYLKAEPFYTDDDALGLRLARADARCLIREAEGTTLATPQDGA